jgi:hypothetical protein
MMQFELLTPQMQAVVTTEVLLAIEKVKKRPRHEEPQSL